LVLHVSHDAYRPDRFRWQLPHRIYSKKKTRPAGEEPCGIVLRRRSSRRKVAELGARTRDLAGARTRPWAAAILVDTSSHRIYSRGSMKLAKAFPSSVRTYINVRRYDNRRAMALFQSSAP
jgi:hypothetical protein